MIKRKPKVKNTKRISDPYYELVYDYMIGDSNGDTTEEVEVSLDNPYVERYVELLDKLKATPGHWGVMLEDGRIYDHYKDKQITKDDYCFLMRMMFPPGYGREEETGEFAFHVPTENKDFANEFEGGVRADAEYSFLVFQGATLYYVDEYGNREETVFVKETKKKKLSKKG